MYRRRSQKEAAASERFIVWLHSKSNLNLELLFSPIYGSLSYPEIVCFACFSPVTDVSVMR